MGLNLLFITLLAVHFHRLSIASYVSHYNPHSVPVFPSDLVDFKHGPLPLDHYGSRVPSELSPSQAPISPHEFFPQSQTLQDLAGEQYFWLNIANFDPITKETTSYWEKCHDLFVKLKPGQAEELEKYMLEHVASDQKERYQVVKWSTQQAKDEVWWDKKLIDQAAANNEYQHLVDVGKLLKFHDPTQNLDTTYIQGTLVPNLHRVLLGEPHEHPLQLGLLHRFTKDNGRSIYQERIAEMAPTMLKLAMEKNLDAMQTLQTLYLAIGHSPKKVVNLSDYPMKKIYAYSHIINVHDVDNPDPPNFHELQKILAKPPPTKPWYRKTFDVQAMLQLFQWLKQKVV